MAIIQGIPSESINTGKRKRQIPDTDHDPSQLAKARKIEKSVSRAAKTEEKILLLESQILASRQHYNEIPTLLRYCQNYNVNSRRANTALVALCRIFCRLMAVGSLSRPRNTPKSEIVIVHWLQSQLEKYRSILVDLFTSANLAMQSTALNLIMRLWNEEAISLDLESENVWWDKTFPRVVSRIINPAVSPEVREEFVSKYVQPYDDVRYYCFACLRYMVDSDP